MSTRTVTAVLEAKVNGYTTGMQKAATETSKLERTVDKAETGSRRLGTTMAAVGTVVGGAAVIGAVRSAITAASDLNETQSKTKVIFGDSSAAIESWSDSAATRLGQSKQQAMDAAGGFAVFGRSAGLAGDDLVGFSTGLSEVASDLASFYNTSTDQAITAIGAALRGEAEPIRAYGVLLDDATLKQEAMRQGLITTTKDALTPQQRVLAAHAVILQQTTVAQGDFARTADGLANSQRILSAEWKNAQAQLGQVFLPAAKSAVTTLGDLLGIFTGLSPQTQATAVQTGLFAAALALTGPKIADNVTKLRAMDAASRSAAVGVGVLYASIIALAGTGIYLKTTADGLTDLGRAADDSLSKLSSKATSDNINQTTAEVEALKQKIFELGSNEWGFTANIERGVDGFRKLFTGRSTIDDITDAMARQKKIQSDYALVIDDVQRITGVSREQAIALADANGVDLTKGVTSAADAVVYYYDSQVRANTSADRGATAMDTLADKTATAEEKTKAYKTALDELNTSNIDAEAASDRLKEAEDRAAASRKENGATLDANTEKGRANRAALRDIATAALDAANKTYEQTGSQKKANEKLEEGRTALIKQATQMGMTKTEAKKYADQVLGIPKTRKTAVGLTGVQKALNDIAMLKEGLGSLSSPAAARLQKEEERYKPRATGGGMYGGDFVIGERGPERLRMNSSGTAGWVTAGTGSVPAPRAARGGVTVQPGAIQVAVSGTNLTGADVERAVDRGFRQFVREMEMAS